MKVPEIFSGVVIERRSTPVERGLYHATRRNISLLLQSDMLNARENSKLSASDVLLLPAEGERLNVARFNADKYFVTLIPQIPLL